MSEQDQSKFIEFHHHEQRIEALEGQIDLLKNELIRRALSNRRVIKAILAYVDADMQSTWLASGKELSEALHAALKE